MRTGNDHQGREAKRRRCINRSWRKQGGIEEERVLMEGDIRKSHIKTGVKKVHLVAFLCPRVDNKHVGDITKRA